MDCRTRPKVIRLDPVKVGAMVWYLLHLSSSSPSRAQGFSGSNNQTFHEFWIRSETSNCRHPDPIMGCLVFLVLDPM